MLALIEHLMVPMAISAAIGVATGWWMFGGARDRKGG